MRKDNLLLRYLEEKQFVDLFMDGHIRFNCLGFFWGEHDDPTKEGQIDAFEGLVCGIDAKSTDDCHRGMNYQYCNVLCCHRLNYVIDGENIGWYTNEYMSKFGDYVVIIKDKNEFQRRLVRAATLQEYKCGCCNVDYSNRITYDRDAFDKEPQYAYQNEWRAALCRGVEICEPYELYVGQLSDIAEWCPTSRLNHTLEQIFRRRDFKQSDDSYYGNIERLSLGQMFI